MSSLRRLECDFSSLIAAVIRSREVWPLGLRLLDWGPVLFARPRRPRRMRALSHEARLAYLNGWLEAGGLRGALLLGLRVLVFMAFYQHPQVLESLGVDWQGRADRLTRERARLLAGDGA